MDSIRLQREHLNNKIQHDCFTSSVPKMVETNQVRVTADSTTTKQKGRWLSSTQRYTALGLLYTFLFSLYALYFHSATSGLFDQLTAVTEGDTAASGLGPHKTYYTGIARLDKYLKNSTVFFEPLMSRVDDSSYLFWAWMVPQLGVMWAMVMMENLRGGPGKETYITALIVGEAIQHLTVGVTLPAYLLYLTLRGPLSRTTGPNALTIPLRISSRHLLILPISVFLGYFVPSIAMMLPDPLITNDTRQLLIAIWQQFPVYTIAIQAGLNAFAQWAEVASHGREKEDKLKSEEARTVRYLYDARTVYLIAFAVAGFCHLNVIAICTFPEWLTAQFPFGTFSDVTFSSVFIPHVPTLGYKIWGLVDGIQAFLQYDDYIASFALLLYIGNMLRNAEKKLSEDESNSAARYWVKMLAYTMVSGPVGAAVMGMWERDERVVAQLVDEARELAKEQKIAKDE